MSTIVESPPRPDSPVPSQPGGRPKWRPPTGSLTWYLYAGALVVTVLAPVTLFYARAFANGGSAIRGLPHVPDLGSTLATTLLLAVGSTLWAAVFGVALACLVVRVPPRWRSLAAIIPQLPLVIPQVAMIIGWIFLFAPTIGYGNTLLRHTSLFGHLDNGPINVYSMPAIIIITGIDLTGIVFAFVYARIHEIGGSLAAAARLSGASAFRAFMTVTLPLLRPSLVSSMVVVFLLGLGQFTAPLLLGSADGIVVLTTEIFRLREQYPIDYAATAALGLPLLAVGLFSIAIQRVAVGDQRRYITQGTREGTVANHSRGSLVWVIAYGLVTTLLPLLALALVAFSPFWTGDLGSLRFTLDNVTSTLSQPEVRQAIINSTTTSILAALIVLPLGFVAALGLSGVVRAPRPVQYALELVFIAPLAVPRAMLGMAILYVFLRPPFSLYGTLTLFVVGYVFVVLPFALRAQQASLMGVHRSLFEAAHVCGAGRLRMIWTIAVPLTKRGTVASLAIMVILLSHDFAVSVMLRSPGNQVMGTVIYEFWQTGVFPQVAVMALLTTVVTATLLAITLRISGRSALENL